MTSKIIPEIPEAIRLFAFCSSRAKTEKYRTIDIPVTQADGFSHDFTMLSSDWQKIGDDLSISLKGFKL